MNHLKRLSYELQTVIEKIKDYQIDQEVLTTLTLVVAELHQFASENPPPGLLMSIALRLDHALASPGYYDSIYGEGHHKSRVEMALIDARRVWEECSGNGFYSPEKSRYYRDLEKDLK
jgi:hypothetical protein